MTHEVIHRETEFLVSLLSAAVCSECGGEMKMIVEHTEACVEIACTACDNKDIVR